MRPRWIHHLSGSNKHVILLPGYSETQFIFSRIGKQLKMHNISFQCIKYNSFLGDLEVTSDEIGKYLLDFHKSNPNKEIYLIGHSMGGLIGKFICLHNQIPIKKLIMVATPHNGTKFGFIGIGKAAAQLTPYSSFLKKTESIPSTEIVNYYSEMDNLIIPNNSCLLQNNDNLTIKGMHNSTVLLSDNCRDILMHVYE
ncbi:MAG: alpha/beta hydrolase [bacterium]|nr:alpha/beta hydrolase [bacterium]